MARLSLLFAFLLLLAGAAHAQPLASSDFVRTASQGYGDRQNSWPWSMLWWEKQNKLFVGTARAKACTDHATVKLFRPHFAPYPPRDRDIACTPDFHDLPLQAEIWSWSADTGIWKRVFQSPNDVPIPAHPGKLVAPDIGFRGMQLFTEPDGTEALYVSGVSSRSFNEENKKRYLNDPELPPPRILRSADGETFAPIPQPPGSLWHQLLPLDGFRGMTSYRDRLYMIASSGGLGHGSLLETADPARGTDVRRIQVTPRDLALFEVATYNGFLYVGTGGQPLHGDPPFSVWKTDASGALPYSFTQVIPPGAFRPGRQSAAAISMFEFKGRLYVGTGQDLFRINPDDSWDLVVGAPRNTPSGPLEPLSGFGDGFNTDTNVHMWRMESHDGVLYVGTLDVGPAGRNVPGLSSVLRQSMGFDLYASDDGWHFTRVTRTGFSELGGDGALNEGVRTLASTPRGLFVGAANPYFGLNLWRGEAAATPVAAPLRVEAEITPDAVVLSWERPEGASAFHVLRDTNSSAPREIAVAGPFGDGETVAVVARRRRSEAPANYRVVAEDAAGKLSRPSNVAPVPSLARPVDFGRLLSALAQWGSPSSWLQQLQDARAAAAGADYPEAGRRLRLLLASVEPSFFRGEDFRALLRKLIQRVTLVQLGLIPFDALQAREDPAPRASAR